MTKQRRYTEHSLASENLALMTEIRDIREKVDLATDEIWDTQKVKEVFNLVKSESVRHLVERGLPMKKVGRYYFGRKSRILKWLDGEEL